MIDENFILSEVKKSQENQRTTTFIRNFVFKIVDEASRSIYGNNYSNRCAQTSEAIKTLLNDFGIKSSIWTGTVCILQVFPQKGGKAEVRWNGFWDDQTHLFNITEFNELVDLSISQIHLINLVNKDIHPFLPFWWRLSDKLPPIFLYIKQGYGKYGIPDDDKDNYTLFMKEVKDIKNKYMETLKLEDIRYGDILSNLTSLQILAYHNIYLKAALYVMQSNMMPNYPDYFQERLNYSQNDVL